MDAPATRFTVLLFTDIVNSTGLKETHGTVPYASALRKHNEIFETLAAGSDGVRILKHTGDGYFATSEKVVDAVTFALQFQTRMQEEEWGEIVLSTRIGLHLGEVAVIESLGQHDCVGMGADTAARVMTLARGGQILLTKFLFDEARHHLRRNPDSRSERALVWMAHGPYRLQGLCDTIEVFEVGIDGLCPLTAPPDGPKATREIRPVDAQMLGWRPAVGLQVPGRTGWTLTESLGVGGFGEVWLATHSRLKQERAFKFCFDHERLRALKREVTLIRLMREMLGNRADIVRLHDVRFDEQPFYIESDYVPGGNLSQWVDIKGGLGSIPLGTRMRIAAGIAIALDAAHSAGVIHKDLKPNNVLIEIRGGEPCPMLVDFGIGSVCDAENLSRYEITAGGFTLTDVGSSSGTPLYAPPENSTGAKFTRAGDIYSFGVILYQLVVGSFREAVGHGWERNVTDPFLTTAIARCLDVDPTRRVQRLNDVAWGLQRYDILKAWRVRRKRLFYMGIVLACAALVTTVGVLSNLGRIGSVLGRTSYDLSHILSSRSGPKDIILVGMTPEAAEKLGRGWSRKLHAQLIDGLRHDGARAVVFDVLFADASEPTDDQAFIEAAKAMGSVFLGGGLNITYGNLEQILPPASILRREVAGWGLLVFRPIDPDFGVRQIYPGLDIKASAMWVVAEKLNDKWAHSAADRLKERWLRYYGPAGTFPMVPYDEALNMASERAGRFKNKIVLVGGFETDFVDAKLGKDQFTTPFSRWRSGVSTPGLEIHATELANLLHNEWWKRLTPSSERWMFLMAGILASISFVVRWPSIRAIVLCAVGVSVLVFAVGAVSAQFFRLWGNWAVIAMVQVPIAACIAIVLHVSRNRSVD